MASTETELKSITLPGGVATYTDRGEGVPVIAVHGIPGNHRVWRAMGPELEADCRVLSVNLPGFEGTAIRAGWGYSQSDVAGFVSRFARALGLERYVLMAHSWGGAACIRLAALERSVVGLALFASVGPMMHRGWKTTPRPDVVSRLLHLPGMKTAVRGMIRKAMRNVGVPPTTPYSELVHTAHYAGHLDFRRTGRDVQDLSQPTFLVWSEDDRVVESAVANDLAARCPAGPRIRFYAAGHNPQRTRAPEVAQRLRPWLTRIWREAD